MTGPDCSPVPAGGLTGSVLDFPAARFHRIRGTGHGAGDRVGVGDLLGPVSADLE
jgi:hypothetical protein